MERPGFVCEDPRRAVPCLLEEACNGTLGTVLINMRTMHDAGIGYHMGKRGGLSMSAVGAPARHAGKIDVDRFFPKREGK